MTGLPPGSSHFLRLMFMTYWENAEPSAETFYASNPPFVISPKEIKTLQHEAVTMLRGEATSNMSRVIDAVYLCYSAIVVDSGDATELAEIEARTISMAPAQ